MAKLGPFLKFNDGKCAEAMNFYKDILGGTLEMSVVKDTPMASEFPEESQNRIMHSVLMKDGWTLMASDMMMDRAVVGDHAGVFLECESEEEIKRIFERLCEGGDVFAPLQDMFWGATFGSVTDKYGVEWMLNFQK